MFANFFHKISAVSVKRSAQAKAPVVAPIMLRTMLTIAQHVRLLDLLTEGKNYTAVGYQHRIKESSVHYIKKEESTMF